MVAIDAGLQQPTDDARVAAFGCADEAGPVVAVLVVDLGAVVEHQLEQARIVADLAGGDQVRALLGLVLGVDVGAGLDQCARGRQVVGERGGDQLGVEPPLRPVGRRGPVPQPADNVERTMAIVTSARVIGRRSG